jgi:hypothetical protein
MIIKAEVNKSPTPKISAAMSYKIDLTRELKKLENPRSKSLLHSCSLIK